MNNRNWGGAVLLSKKEQYQLQFLVMKYAFFPASNTHAMLLNDHYLTKGNRQKAIILLLYYLRRLLERPTID